MEKYKRYEEQKETVIKIFEKIANSWIWYYFEIFDEREPGEGLYLKHYNEEEISFKKRVPRYHYLLFLDVLRKTASEWTYTPEFKEEMFNIIDNRIKGWKYEKY